MLKPTICQIARSCLVGTLLAACGGTPFDAGTGLGTALAALSSGWPDSPDPSSKFDIFDPQAGVEGIALPDGTETALPPDRQVDAFFASLEGGGGRPYIYYDLHDAGQYLNVRTSLAAREVLSSPSSGAYVDVDLGALTVRVATLADPTLK